MTETKTESQNYFANPYTLPFETDQYVISPILFREQFYFFLFFLSPSLGPSRLHRVCHLSNSHESGVIRRTQKPLSVRPPRAWIVLSLRSINSPFPMH